MRQFAHRESIVFLALLLLGGCASMSQRHRVQSQPKIQNLFLNPDPTPPRSRAKNIVVPNRETAIQIAKAIWVPVYGEKAIQSAKSFDAVLADGIWSVTAKLGSGALAEGTAIMDISQEDGRVSKIAHGQFVPGHEWR